MGANPYAAPNVLVSKEGVKKPPQGDVDAYNAYINTYTPGQNPYGGSIPTPYPYGDLGYLGAMDPYTGTGAMTWNSFMALRNALGAPQQPAPPNPTDLGGNTQNPGSGTVPTMPDINNSASLLAQYMPAPFTAEAQTPAPVPYAPINVYNPYTNANPFLTWR